MSKLFTDLTEDGGVEGGAIARVCWFRWGKRGAADVARGRASSMRRRKKKNRFMMSDEYDG